MKNLTLFILISLIFVGCNSKKKEYLALQERYDSLMSIGFTKDTALYSYIESFNRIQANLDSIKQSELLISQNTSNNGELQADQKEQINRDINLIYQKLQQNKKTIAELKANLRKSGGKVTELQKMIDRMAIMVEEKENEITLLRGHLEEMNVQIELLHYDIDNLTADANAKAETISEQTTALNTAWYVVGTKRELFDNNILTREGGFAGIGSNKKLKQDFSRDYFTTVDITNLRSIPLTKKKATLVTTHPSQSYILYGEKERDSLVITNPKEFWSVSKYLVILID